MTRIHKALLLFASAVFFTFALLSTQLAQVALEEVGGTTAGVLGLGLFELSLAYSLLAAALVGRAAGKLLWFTAERLNYFVTPAVFSLILPFGILTGLDEAPLAAAALAFCAGLLPTFLCVTLTRAPVADQPKS